ncbi:MAG: hypothetical protein WBL63_17990 [Candidatus Acidiferrum sp.]
MPAPTDTLAPPHAKAAAPAPAMSDAVAAPVPNRSNPLRKPTSAETTHQLLLGLGGIIVGGALGAVFYYFGLRFLAIADWVVAIGGSLVIILGSRDEVSACPFCGATLDILPKPDASGKPIPAQCKKCWEYSGLQKGFVSPYNPNAVEDRPTFQSPIEQTVLWPRGCAQCGAEPTHFEEVGTVSTNKGLLVVGLVRVSSFKLKGVPYCDAHKKAVEMTTGIDNRVYLKWRSLAMMRRFMAANRGRFTAQNAAQKK